MKVCPNRSLFRGRSTTGANRIWEGLILILAKTHKKLKRPLFNRTMQNGVTFSREILIFKRCLMSAGAELLHTPYTLYILSKLGSDQIISVVVWRVFHTPPSQLFNLFYHCTEPCTYTERAAISGMESWNPGCLAFVELFCMPLLPFPHQED